MRVFVDYAEAPSVAAMRVGGMTVAERVLREAARAGATAAVVRVDTDALPAMSELPLAIERIPLTADAPELPRVDGRTIAGIEISDEASRRRAGRALLQSLRRPHDGLGDRFVIRPISLRLTALLCRLGATPNQVTCANILIGLVACAFAAGSTSTARITAGVAIILQVILDSCDGELARLRYMSSKLGMWLDNVSDDVIDALFLVALGVGVGGPWLYVGLGAALAKGTVALMIHIDVARRGKAGDILAFQWFFDGTDEDLADRFDTDQFSVLGVGRAFGRRDLYLLVWGTACIVGIPELALGLAAAISGVYFGLGVAHVVAKSRSAA